MNRLLISNLLGLIGGAVGGVLGFYTFGWLEGHGFYGLAIPGAFLGLGCGLVAQHRSRPRGVACAVAALLLSIYAEWKYHPFLADGSLTYMLRHLNELSPVTLLMMTIGAGVAYWVGQDAGFRLLPGSHSASLAEAQPPGPHEED